MKRLPDDNIKDMWTQCATADTMNITIVIIGYHYQ